MQGKAKILYEAISQVIVEQRKISDKNYLDFCDENSIATSTYDNIINATSKATFYNIAKVVKGLNLNFEQFGKLLDERLPKEFWEEE